MVRISGIATLQSWRTGLLLAVGGEFGFALIAIALQFNVIEVRLGQIALASVFFSMIIGSILIRFNGAMASLLSITKRAKDPDIADESLRASKSPVLIGGYGRVGHTIAVLLQSRGIPYLALDTDMDRVAQGRADGYQVIYGDISDAE